MVAQRRVLLLGEGNFSFAASLSGDAGTSIVATCYESEEEELKLCFLWTAPG